MQITHDEILHLAELSNLSLSSDEIDPLKTDLTRIIDYISQLDDLDVSGVEPTYQVGGTTNIWRADEISEVEADREALLALSPEVEDYQMKVPKVL